MAAKRKSKGAYMISAVAEMYEIHPQTLRLYEREGLLKPSRTEGNTRLYTDEDLERLEFILNLARDLGVNIAGIAIILQMRERMEEMNRQMQSFVEYVRTEMLARFQQAAPGSGRGDCAHAQARGGAKSPAPPPSANRRAFSHSSCPRCLQVFLSCMSYVLLALAVFGLVTSTVFAGMVLGRCPAICAKRRRALAELQARPGFTPPLTLLKPVHGDEPGLEAHLATFFEQDYPEYEILFCARSADDAGLETARRVAARYPHIPAKFLSTGGQPDYINAKVASMERWRPRRRTRFWSSATAMCA
jgi:MerR family transcriptional regulator/heat shock protein HspR